MASMFPGGMPGGMQGMPGAEPPAKADDGKMMDLTDKIDKSESYAKNEAASFPMTNLFIGDSRLGCKSDADEQLILHIAFQEFVKVRSMCLWVGYPKQAVGKRDNWLCCNATHSFVPSIHHSYS